MIHEYFDKFGSQIKAGDVLVHDDIGAAEEKVFSCSSEEDPDDKDLGFLASNPESPSFRKFEYYPLSEFNLSEWRIKK